MGQIPGQSAKSGAWGPKFVQLGLVRVRATWLFDGADGLADLPSTAALPHIPCRHAQSAGAGDERFRPLGPDRFPPRTTGTVNST